MAIKIPLITPKLTYYSKCDDILLSQYAKYLDTSDKLWLTNYHHIKEKYRNEPEIDDILLNSNYLAFYDDMLKISGNYNVKSRFKRMRDMLYYRNKFETVNYVINVILGYGNRFSDKMLDDYLSILLKYNYRIDKNKPLTDQLKKIKQRSKGLLTEAKAIEADLFKENKQEKSDIEEEIITVEQSLSLGYRIKKDEITVKEWLYLKKRAIEHNERIAKLNKGSNGAK